MRIVREPSVKNDPRGKSESKPPKAAELRGCHNCLHAVWDEYELVQSFASGWPRLPMCSNHPDWPGQMRRVCIQGACRNWRPKPEPGDEEPPAAYAGECQIHLTRGLVALVDPEDYEWLSEYTWHAKRSEGRFYAGTVIDGEPVSMHRLIMDPPPGMSVDHKNNSTLDNHRENLRLVTRAQNRYNTRPSRKLRPNGRPKSSQYLGVSRYGDRWKAKITHDGHRYVIGLFDDEIEAALARDAKARQLHGEYAWLNFPDGPPPGYEGWKLPRDDG